jgi:hypothetical protein
MARKVSVRGVSINDLLISPSSLDLLTSKPRSRYRVRMAGRSLLYARSMLAWSYLNRHTP